VKDMR